MTLAEATRILKRVPALRKYPKFYVLPIQFGFCILAAEGKHRGAGMGVFELPNRLRLYGLWNFRRNGGYAYCRHYKTHEHITLRRRA